MNRKERRAARKAGGPAADVRQAAGRNSEAESALTFAIYCHQDGQAAAAETHFNRAIKLDPNLAEAHHGLARLLMEQDRLDEAMARLRRALALRPDDTDARMTLVMLLKQQGKWAAAADSHQNALASDPRSMALRQQLLDELSAPWARPTDLARASISFIRLNPVVAAAAERSTQAWPTPLSAQDLFGPAGIRAIADDRLLVFLLQASAICDVELERLLTRARAALLATIRDHGGADDDLTAWCCALASQCFLNDYVYFADEEESRDAIRLRGRLTGAIEAGEDFPPIWLPAVGSYFPLYTLPGVDRLLGKTWPAPIAALLRQQVAEPREEQACRATIPAITPIEDETSQRVRRQYEENPFPRWVKPTPAGQTTAIDAFIRQRFPRAPYRDLGAGTEIEILVAGCGTGQQSIETAQRFGSTRLLAVDLSLSSLAFAQRQSRACGLRSIEYAQADIMNLPATGRSFDLIECSGVLHHLADPLEGWRRLQSMLRPHGVMRIGLYSELARGDIVAAQRFTAERGDGDSADAIRRFRQDIMTCADGTAVKNVTTLPAFYNTSECRDMLFHVMEHRLTLPAIKAFLAENELEFLGFDVEDIILVRYSNRFPADKACTDLDSWHQFEQRNPSTFISMYQFWVQKPA